MKKLLAPILLLFFSLTSLSCGQPGASLTQTPVQIDLTYCTTSDGVNLTMDVYRPQSGAGPFPAVVLIHGGGWTSGDKSDGVGLNFKDKLVHEGYVFFSINYRLAPKYSFPAPIEDVKCAIRHLRANAAPYNLDPQRIGVMGGSAGGHLAALLGLSDASEGWDVGQYPDQSSRVQAVVDMYGPSDLAVLFDPYNDKSAMIRAFNASHNDDPVLSVYSPINYITPDDPPFLLMHGDKDTTVPLEQSQILYDRLKAAGVPVELVVVKNGGHSFRAIGANIRPNMEKLTQMVVDFFDQYLRH